MRKNDSGDKAAHHQREIFSRPKLQRDLRQRRRADSYKKRSDTTRKEG